MSQNDPEKLNLSKADIISIIDRRLAEWNKNKKDNWEYILEAHAIKLLIKRQKEEKFSHFWNVLIKDIDAVRVENTRKTIPGKMGDILRQISNSSNKYSLDFKVAK